MSCAANQVYLRVPKRLLLDVSPASPTPTPPYSRPAEHLVYILAGSLEDVQQYSGTTVQWLITITRLIFREIIDSILLYTPKDGYDENWYDTERDDNWQLVGEGDTLRATIYEIFIHPPVTYTKISLRHKSSKTSTRSRDKSKSLLTQITSRDQSCVVSHADRPVTASHLLPKRMGDDLTKEIFRSFAPTEHAQYGSSIDIFHPSLGILASKAIDDYIGKYTVGFFCLDAVSQVLNINQCIAYSFRFLVSKSI